MLGTKLLLLSFVVYVSGQGVSYYGSSNVRNQNRPPPRPLGPYRSVYPSNTVPIRPDEDQPRPVYQPPYTIPETTFQPIYSTSQPALPSQPIRLEPRPIPPWSWKPTQTEYQTTTANTQFVYPVNSPSSPHYGPKAFDPESPLEEFAPLTISAEQGSEPLTPEPLTPQNPESRPIPEEPTLDPEQQVMYPTPLIPINISLPSEPRPVEPPTDSAPELLPPRPIEPLQPPRPIEPIQPPSTIEPLQPPRPIEPMQPPRPIEPLQPPSPIEPLQPPRPIEPIQPPSPIESLQPPRPIEPMQPPRPIEPLQPPSPIEPLLPPTPIEPLQPPRPIEPMQPPRPVEPMQPSIPTYLPIPSAPAPQAIPDYRPLELPEILPGFIDQNTPLPQPLKPPTPYPTPVPSPTYQPLWPQPTTYPVPVVTQKPNRPRPTLAPVQSQVIPMNDFQCKNSNEYYNVINECDTYIECQSNRAYKHTCPDGLHFNQEALYPEYPCAYPSQVQCASNSAIQVARPTNECPNRYGFFSIHGGDCSKYIMCQEGRASVMNCPFGLVFNDLLSSCDWPENVPQCNPEAFKDFTCPIPPADDPDLLTRHRYGSDCVKYVACQRGHPRLLSCDWGFSFDQNSQVCIDTDLVPECISNNRITNQH